MRRVWLLAAVVAVFLATSAVPALAQSYPGGGQTPDVEGRQFFPDSPKTGSNLLWMIVLAIALIVLGLAIRASMKQRSAPGER